MTEDEDDIPSRQYAAQRGTLEFDLGDPDARTAFRRAVVADDLVGVIWDFQQWLREKIKYAPEGQSKEETEAYENARSSLSGILEERGVDISSM